MAKKRAVRALITETNQAKVPLAGQTNKAVVALPTSQPSSSRPSKRARTSTTEPPIVDEEETMLPQTTPPSPQPEHSDRASPSEWVPKVTYKNRAITDSDSVVAEKDHSLAFNLTKSVCLPADMEHHEHLTKLKAIRSATKSMVLALQKNHIVHKCVLELRKTTRQAVVEANAKSAELKESQQKMAELQTEVAQLTGLVNFAEADKQRAAAVLKDKYLRELAKLEGKKNVEIVELEKKANDAEDRGYKESKATYIKQCEAAKDIFFKCGWKATVAQLGHGPKTEVFQKPPPHYIPSYMVEYATAIQQKFLQKGEEEEESKPNNAPAVVNDPAVQSAWVEPPVEDLVDNVTELPAETGLRVDLDADLDDLFA